MHIRYDQAKMRSHFLECFTNGKVAPFPSRKIKPPKPLTKKCVSLYCHCLLPEDGEEMALCGNCQGWFHKSCEAIPGRIFSEKDISWVCSQCI